jgi:hypothetical protein
MEDQPCEWKPIEGYSGYEISSNGIVVSTKYKRSHSLRYTIHNGYYQCCLSQHSVERHHNVHHLVLLAFIGPRPTGAECRHLNGDPKDNRAENLAWGTGKDNANDREMHGRQVWGELVPQHKLTPNQVRAIRAGPRTNQRATAKEYGVSQSSISRIINYKNWSRV